MIVSLSLSAVLSFALLCQERPQAFPKATPASQGLSPEALTELTSIVGRHLEKDDFVGAELLILANRRTVLHEFFGHADRQEELAWSDQTICNIRSMTKTLTGAALQILVDRGKVSLDERVAEYLPGFDNDASREITVQQVLTHRAGLPLTILRDIGDYPDLITMANAVGERGPQYPPDSRFWYSDSGTDVVAAIVEVVAETTIDTFIHEELLTPLGMNDSFYYLDGEDPRRSRIASLYIGGRGKWQRFLDPDDGPFYPYAWGSQTLYSTPTDYAKFLCMWMDGGMAGGKRILSEEAVERTLTPASPMSMLGSSSRFPTSFKGLEVMYGQMSVLHTPTTSPMDGPVVIFGHSGSDGTIAWTFPEQDLVVLLFTQSRGGTAVLRLEEPIDRLLIQPDAYVGFDDIPDELRPYTGTYIADWASHMKEEFEVSVRNGQLALDIPTQMLFDLEPIEGQDRWHFAISDGVTVWFDRDAKGNVDCLRIKQGPMTFEAPRKGTSHEKEVAKKNRPDPDLVDAITGTYLEADTGNELKVFLKGDYVVIQSPEQTFHLWKIPVDDAWQVRENPTVSITFQKDQDIVVSLTRHAPGGAKTLMERIE